MTSDSERIGRVSTEAKEYRESFVAAYLQTHEYLTDFLKNTGHHASREWVIEQAAAIAHKAVENS